MLEKKYLPPVLECHLALIKFNDEIEFKKSRRSSNKKNNSYTVSILDLQSSYEKNEEVLLRVNIFDKNSPKIKFVKVPVELKSLIDNNSYFRIRDSVTDEILIPFDLEKKSTILSSDASCMFFSFNTNSLISGRTYVIDLMISGKIYKNCSSEFLIRK